MISNEEAMTKLNKILIDLQATNFEELLSEKNNAKANKDLVDLYSKVYKIIRSNKLLSTYYNAIIFDCYDENCQILDLTASEKHENLKHDGTVPDFSMVMPNKVKNIYNDWQKYKYMIDIITNPKKYKKIPDNLSGPSYDEFSSNDGKTIAYECDLSNLIDTWYKMFPNSYVFSESNGFLDLFRKLFFDARNYAALKADRMYTNMEIAEEYYTRTEEAIFDRILYYYQPVLSAKVPSYIDFQLFDMFKQPSTKVLDRGEICIKFMVLKGIVHRTIAEYKNLKNVTISRIILISEKNMVKYNKKSISLEPLSFALLEALYSTSNNQGKNLSTEWLSIYNKMKNKPTRIKTAIRSVISKLKRKLEEIELPDLIISDETNTYMLNVNKYEFEQR